MPPKWKVSCISNGHGPCFALRCIKGDAMDECLWLEIIFGKGLVRRMGLRMVRDTRQDHLLFADGSSCGNVVPQVCA